MTNDHFTGRAFIGGYTVFDKKSSTYIPPFFVHTNREAIETIEPILKLRKSKLAEFPEDFVIYKICDFDPQNGTLVMHPVEVVIEVAQIRTATDKFEESSNG